MKPGRRFFLAAMSSSTLSFGLSLVNLMICMTTVSIRFKCFLGPRTQTGSKYMGLLIINQYIQDEECNPPLRLPGFTPSHKVYVMSLCLLVFAAITLATSCILIIAAHYRRPYPMASTIAAYLHLIANVVVLIMEVTFAAHFAIDYNIMTRKMDEYLPGLGHNYSYDMLRHGAFFLICLLLKGFFAPAVNLFLLPLVVYYAHLDPEPRPQEPVLDSVYLQCRIPWPPIHIPEPAFTVERRPSRRRPRPPSAGAYPRPRLQPEFEFEASPEIPIRLRRPRERHIPIVV